ncbi:MAG TPA: autotransporter domain-containing protein [Xanthobacteraceae bacterium]
MKLATALGAGAACLLGATTASAQSFNQAIVFGDSTVDSGFYKALPNPGGGAAYNALWPTGVAHGAGAPTTNPGMMNSQVLAAYFGLTANPANQPGGTNFATSGAKDVTINTAATGGFKQAIPTVTQIANYLAANGGVANRDGLYLISSGGNDITFALGQSGTGPFPVNPAAYVTSAATSLAASVASLQAAGARYIVVPDLPYSFPTNNAGEQALKLGYSQTLWSSLAAAGVSFIPADFNSVRLAILANPGEFGFIHIGTGAGQMACTQPAGVTTAWALLCSSDPAAPSHLVAPGAEQFDLFADDQHMTTAGQKIQADYYYSLVVAPSMISMLAEAPVKTRAAVVDTIYNQITRGDRQRGPNGFNIWTSIDASSLAIDNFAGFPSDPGIPVYGSVGVDYGRGNWLVGAALTLGGQKASFSQNFGSFTQDEFAASLYGAYRTGPLWTLAIASAGAAHYDVKRTVPIGITIQNNSASTDGSNFSLASFTGLDIVSGSFTHGPVAGIILQRVFVDGFAESGNFTSLSFGSQIRDSAVTALGYRASLTAGRWQPFAQVLWDHEFASTDRLVTASLTTIAAPSYSMPAVVLGKDWAAGTLGTTYAWDKRYTALIAFTGEIAQAGAAAYGGQIGLNVAF